MWGLKELKKTFHPKSTLSKEVFELPDGTQVTKNYDKTGIRIIEVKYCRPNGTLQMKKEYNKEGRWVTVKYDETGKKPLVDLNKKYHKERE